MKYNKFLFKSTLFMMLFYVVGVLSSFLLHMLWLKHTPIEDMLYPITQMISWILTSYIFFIDMNNNMISRLVINGATRAKIWLAKGVTVISASLIMIVIQAAAIIAANGSLNGCHEAIKNVSVITLLLMTFIGSLTGSLSVIIRNMSVVVILVFAYISPWTYSIVASFCERSAHSIIKNNPFYLLLKMTNTGVLDKTGIIFCCATAAVLWLISFVIIQRMELKEDN